MRATGTGCIAHACRCTRADALACLQSLCDAGQVQRLQPASTPPTSRITTFLDLDSLNVRCAAGVEA
jgi:hypothetical protein